MAPEIVPYELSPSSFSCAQLLRGTAWYGEGCRWCGQEPEMNHQNHNGFDPFVKFPLCSATNSVGQDEIWYISGENVPCGQSQSHRRISWPSFSTLFIALFSFFLSILSDSTNWHASIHMQLKPSRLVPHYKDLGHRTESYFSSD